MDKMLIYSIMKLNDAEHIDEICEDIKMQYETGVSNCALFCMPLAPEGTPPADKAGEFAKKYILFRDKLNKMGIKCGILVQSSIGHGATCASETLFQKYVNLTDGEKKYNHCPYDDDFCNHFKDVMATLAKCEPEVIMVDDDFRLIGRAGKGCACPKHMAEAQRRLGKEISREELFEAMEKNPKGEEAKVFIETQRDSLLKCAKKMREGIDSVNPHLQGAFCTIQNRAEFAGDIAKVLAGEGNKVIVRINNGNYTSQGARYVSKYAYRAAVQIHQLKDKADVILAETDTCPHNRYSTGAQSLHSHFTATILEGAFGAKHWLTRSYFEPNSGKAYRKILAKNRKFYDELAYLTPSLKWLGCKMPLTKFNEFEFKNHGWDGTDGWSTHVLERFGIPLYFSADDGGAAFLAEDADEKFCDDEILNLLKGPLFLTSNTALNLIKRGFGKYLGVDVKEWNGLKPTVEKLDDNGGEAPPQVDIKELVPLSDEVKIDSKVYHSLDGTNYTYLFPGVTIYKNGLGGTVIVFCGTCVTTFHYAKAFSFLNESRKKQLVRILKAINQLPVYYKGDEEVYLKAAKTADGKVFCIMFNMGFDIIDEIVLETDFNVNEVKMLMCDGTYKDCIFKKCGNGIVIEENAYTLNPAAFVIS